VAGVEGSAMPSSDRSSGRRFDKEHGVTTHAVMLLSQLDDDRSSEAYAHVTHYEAVPVADLRKMLACVPEAFARDATFVDVGAGMGRAVLMASEYPFKQIVGIELSPALFEIARENVARAHDLKTQCRDIRLTCGDARKRRFPNGNLVVFLFNPFDAGALRTTLERVVASRSARDVVYVLYHTPEHLGTLLEFGGEPIAGFPFGVISRLDVASRASTSSESAADAG
jgi:SAM-dependent methyltransferase